MKLHSARHGAQVQRRRRRLFSMFPSRSVWTRLVGYTPELLLIIGLGLICWAVTWWSTPIAIITTGVVCIITAWLVALGSSRSSQ